MNPIHINCLLDLLVEHDDFAIKRFIIVRIMVTVVSNMRIFTIIRLINLIVHIRAPNFLPSTDMNVIRIQVSGHSLIILSRHKL